MGQISTKSDRLPKTLHITWKNHQHKQVHKQFAEACQNQGRVLAYVLVELMQTYINKHGGGA